MFDPELYMRQNATQKRDALLVVKKMFHELRWKDEEKILDVGCGPGDLTSHIVSFLPKDATMVGGDISVEMIKYARKQYASDRISFELLDIQSPEVLENWKNEKESFDKILSFYCLHWATDLKQVVRNITFLLRNEGELLTLTVLAHPFFQLFNILSKNPKWNDGTLKSKSFEAVCRDFDYRSFVNLLKSSGFRVLLAEPIDRTNSHTDMNQLLEHVASLNPFRKGKGDSANKELLAECAKILLAENLVQEMPDGSVNYEFQLLLVHAAKDLETSNI